MAGEAWKHDNESVKFVEAHIQKEKAERAQGVLQRVWNTARSMLSKPRTTPQSVEVKQEDLPPEDEVSVPPYFTGELPLNSMIEISCLNRPDPEPVARKIRQSTTGHPGDQRIMPFKCPMVFDWPLNKGWKPEERLAQRVRLENQNNPKLWSQPVGRAALDLQKEIKKLHDARKWGKTAHQKVYDDVQTKYKRSFSPKKNLLCKCMCNHVLLCGTPTSNPMRYDVLVTINLAYDCQCEFMFDQFEGAGFTGLYAACGHNKYQKDVDSWEDEKMHYAQEVCPMKDTAHRA